jgi:hypothetical protein
MMAATLTTPRPDTAVQAPTKGTRRKTRLVWAGAALVAAIALALGAAALARDDGPATVQAHADVVERGSPRAIEGTVEETAAVAANPGIAESGSPRAVDGTVEETAAVAANPGIADNGSPAAVDARHSGLATRAHPSMIENGSPSAVDARTSGLAAPAHPSMIEHGSPAAVDASTSEGAGTTDGISSNYYPHGFDYGEADDTSAGEFVPGSRHMPSR